MLKKARILVRGLVQGVGFRPNIYRLAVEDDLRGYVSNLGDAGVEIVVEGSDEKISRFIDNITIKKPAIARIDSVEIKWEIPEGRFTNFKISKSDEKKLTVRSVIPTDLSICDLCITDISQMTRWHSYPFTSCAQCGPRFTMIYKIPYDRNNTSMADFPFCPNCQSEYDDPRDRRYDAQGITCPTCGPQLQLLDKSNQKIDGDPLLTAAELLKKGSIIAIKGIGGFHIAVDVVNEEAISKLRKKRNRPKQPFGIMSYSIEEIQKYAEVTEIEKSILSNICHPIVTLKKNNKCVLPEPISPGLDTVGVMLPYTGIHHLLLKYFDDIALVMTSGNYPGRPIIIDNDSAFYELRNIVDYFLIHDRKIVNRCDDSVIKVIGNQPTFIRKSRGYSPSTIIIPWDMGSGNIMSLGGEYNITGSMLVKDRLITTQHIGDANELETIEYLKTALDYILKVYDITNFNTIAYDMNPSFSTTRLAHELSEKYGAKSIPVQHHHAHLSSLMIDHGLSKNENITFIAIDGVGYGEDGMAWGGEIFVGDYEKYERVAQLKYQAMPGGDLCSYYPSRMLASILSSFMKDSEVINFFETEYVKHLKYQNDELDIILKQVKNHNIMKTSSIGRLLDAIAALLNVCHKRTYEGEPPMLLESLANSGNVKNITLQLPISQSHGKIMMDTSELLRSIIEIMKKHKRPDIARAVHDILGKTIGDVALSVCDEFGTKYIGIGGGAAINSLLTSKIKETIESNNINFLSHRDIPCGDGGVSCGQAVVAAAKT